MVINRFMLSALAVAGCVLLTPAAQAENTGKTVVRTFSGGSHSIPARVGKKEAREEEKTDSRGMLVKPEQKEEKKEHSKVIHRSFSGGSQSVTIRREESKGE